VLLLTIAGGLNGAAFAGFGVSKLNRELFVVESANVLKEHTV
jgi:hypothetical protein